LARRPKRIDWARNEHRDKPVISGSRTSRRRLAIRNAFALEGTSMQGKKTHEQQKRILERKEDVPSPHRSDAERARTATDTARTARRDSRQSEYPVSFGGMNQESDHNKHNHQTQQGHKPQAPEPSQEKKD
jgi:hypothetical protein